MTSQSRRQRLASFGLTALLAILVVACGRDYPNTTFSRSSDLNTDIDKLWNMLLLLGSIVFVLVEGWLIYTIYKYRRRGEDDRPEQVHGNTTLEIAWTVIPAVVLAIIAVPTVRTIFKTQAKITSAEALQVEVVGHQWWWEFRYPQYNIVTANELYLPVGRTVNFSLKTGDVLHSFWIPRLGGKRDLISNHTNYLWFTPDSSFAVNGQCAEYCGTSHADMRFRVFTVAPAEFAAWTEHQKTPAAYGAVAAPVTAASATPSPSTSTPAVATASATISAAGVVPAPLAQPVAATVSSTPTWQGPPTNLPAFFVPATPLPPSISIPAQIAGDPKRGQQIYSMQSCIGCHMIKGNPASMGIVGPNLTHVATRATIAAGYYPNDAKHLFAWIKNARVMKPGVIMPTLGKDQYDPVMKNRVTAGGLDDQQIADIVAYLQSLK